MRAQCNSTATITVKHRGKCRKTQQCLINLEYARKHPSAPGDSNYLPTCKPDGTYTPVQCHKDTGYCWCVNAEGRPVPNTSVRRNGSSKPRCGQRGGWTRNTHGTYNNMYNIRIFVHVQANPPQDDVHLPVAADRNVVVVCPTKLSSTTISSTTSTRSGHGSIVMRVSMVPPWTAWSSSGNSKTWTRIETVNWTRPNTGTYGNLSRSL